MDSEDYKLLEATSGEDLFRYVDKYEIDLSKKYLHAQNDEGLSFKPSIAGASTVIRFPVLLPYSRSVVRLNDLL